MPNKRAHRFQVHTFELEFPAFRVVDCLWLDVEGLSARGRDERAQDYHASIDYQGEGGKWISVPILPRIVLMSFQLYEDLDLSTLAGLKGKPFTTNFSTRAMRMVLKSKNIDREVKPPEDVINFYPHLTL